MGLRSWLRRRIHKRLGVPSIPLSLERLAERSFVPKLVFDVGAFQGEFALLTLGLWPSAHVACFEPLGDAADDISRLRTVWPNIDVHRTLVGATQELAVDFRVGNSSSTVLRDAHNHNYPIARIPQTTVDAAVRTYYAGRSPDLLKLDVQGYELEVLKGAEASLGGVRVVLTELSLIDIHEGVPLLNEMLSWFAQRGFVTYDICGLTRRPLDNALWQADLIFIRLDDPLRADKRYFDIPTAGSSA